MERVMIFIDGRNLYYGIKEMCLLDKSINPNLDLYKLSLHAAHNRQLIRMYYYEGILPEFPDIKSYHAQQAKLAEIEKIPHAVVRKGKVVRHGDRLVEKGIDVMIATDMMRMARMNGYETAILISGDADFISVVEEVQDMDKRVELAYMPCTHLGVTLKQKCDYYMEMTSNFLKTIAKGPMPRMNNGMQENRIVYSC